MAVQSLFSAVGQVDHFREAFNLFDSDGGGTIDIEELGSCLRTLGQVHAPSQSSLLRDDCPVTSEHRA